MRDEKQNMISEKDVYQRNKSITRAQIKIVTAVTSRAEQKDPRTNDFYLHTIFPQKF